METINSHVASVLLQAARTGSGLRDTLREALKSGLDGTILCIQQLPVWKQV